MKALLIVDVQNDFLPGGALAIKDGDKIIEIINQLQSQFSCVLATKDWHPHHHISFAEVHGKKPYDIIEIHGLKQELWPAHCIQGSLGAEFSPLLKTDKIDQIFFKGVDHEIDSYSAFYDNAHLRSTGLKEYLAKKGIDEIFIVGLATDYCVKYSVMDAAQIGLKTWIVLDGCQGVELQKGDCERAINEMKIMGAHVTTSLELKSLIAP